MFSYQCSLVWWLSGHHSSRSVSLSYSHIRLGLRNYLFASSFHIEILFAFPSFRECCLSHLANSLWLDRSDNICRWIRTVMLLILYHCHAFYTPRACQPFWFYHSNNIMWKLQIMKIFIVQLCPFSCYFLLGPVIFFGILFPNIFTPCSSFNAVRD
jgi:hypothetical protein